MRDFGVSRERVPTFIEVFTANLTYLKAFAANAEGAPVVSPAAASTAGDALAPSVSSESEGVREFLDTCFVLMPFGEWFDRYYKEIYAPAIKEAGFEPLRADSLFNSGSVIEQIWQQIRKAKALLADLTGKNPNVFYELAVRHAVRKPVIHLLEIGQEIPFDVANVRAVQYSLDDPDALEAGRGDLQRKAEAIGRTDRPSSNPISAARDLQLLRTSGEPRLELEGEILSAIADLRVEVQTLAKRMDERRSRGSAATFEPGDRVQHGTFGEGEVVGTDNQSGLLVVRFAGGEERKLLAGYAPLMRLHT